MERSIRKQRVVIQLCVMALLVALGLASRAGQCTAARPSAAWH